MAAVGVNDEGSTAKLQEFIRICMRHNPLNAGSVHVGNMYTSSADKMIEGVQRHVHAVFDRHETVTQVLKELKEADLGLSVVVSGLLDAVDHCCEEAGLRRHTVELSLGVWGKVEKLESQEVLEVTTMCGHGLVASNLVKTLVDDIRNGRKTARQASEEIAQQCVCGIFNAPRAEELLKSMANRPM
jgi:hypothetical protein